MTLKYHLYCDFKSCESSHEFLPHAVLPSQGWIAYKKFDFTKREDITDLIHLCPLHADLFKGADENISLMKPE